MNLNDSPNLGARDFEMFVKLGISRDLLFEAHVERVSDYDARERYGIKGAGDMSGIVFPYFDPITGVRVTARLRRDHPEIESGKVKRKYVSAWGDRRHLYFPPGSRALLVDEAVPVVFVEAEKSALALVALSRRKGLRMLPIALGGVWGFRGRIGKQQTATGTRVDESGPLPDLDYIHGT